MRILFVGDIVGRSGRALICERLPNLIRDWKLDLVVANGENAAGGFGITADDRVYDFRSFNWASAQLLGALVPVNSGATLVMAEKFSASRFFQQYNPNQPRSLQRPEALPDTDMANAFINGPTR